MNSNTSFDAYFHLPRLPKKLISLPPTRVKEIILV